MEADEDRQCPDDQEAFPWIRGQMEVPFIYVADKGRQARKRPGEEARQENQQIVEPDIIARMFRYGCPQTIMYAEEGVDEILPVHQVHWQVPGRADYHHQQEATEHMPVQQCLEVALPDQEKQDDEAWQQEPDWALGQDAKSGNGEGRIVETGALLRIAEIVADERAGYGQEQCHVRDNCVAQIPVFKRRAKNQGGDEANLLIVEAAAEEIGHEDTDRGKECREETGGKIIDAHDLEGQNELPVEQDRFVIPVVTIDAW